MGFFKSLKTKMYKVTPMKWTPDDYVMLNKYSVRMPFQFMADMVAKLMFMIGYSQVYIEQLNWDQ